MTKLLKSSDIKFKMNIVNIERYSGDDEQHDQRGDYKK